MTELLTPPLTHQPTDLVTPLDRFLREQQELTPVERFSRRTDADDLSDAPFEGPGSTTPRYRDLLPGAGPGPGEQYAFDVDLDACSGCKACVSACHSLNGLDDDETWRSVGVLYGVEAATPQLQTVTTACHHCVDPACLNGCPVDAYEKDPVTGIVVHLDDQCIGCQYCTLMCPYEVPVYDAGRGIVRKCDLCRDRLAEGEAPACVQGCPTDAISVTVVATAELVAQTRAATGSGAATLVPTAPDSSITVPSHPLPLGPGAGSHDGGRGPVRPPSRSRPHPAGGDVGAHPAVGGHRRAGPRPRRSPHRGPVVVGGDHAAGRRRRPGRQRGSPRSTAPTRGGRCSAWATRG